MWRNRAFSRREPVTQTPRPPPIRLFSTAAIACTSELVVNIWDLARVHIPLTHGAYPRALGARRRRRQCRHQCMHMLSLLLSSSLGWAPPHPDAVTSLPGLDGPLRSQLFSGYLRATANGQAFYSHYVLTESRSSPANDPLVLWQQGGPGSSGFGFGFLAEMGPYVLDADSLALNASAPHLFEREYSWDASANVLLFEHPPGTGFSYCVDAAEAPIACTWNDQTQAEAFYNTLLAFYAAFPHYRQHELRLIGESCARHRLPP